MKKARKVHFVLADSNVKYGSGRINRIRDWIMTIREYMEDHDTLACNPQLSDDTRVTPWAPYVTCKACRKTMLDAGLVGVMSHEYARDFVTIVQGMKQSVQFHPRRSQP